MSHSHIRVPKPVPQRNPWVEAAAGLGFLLLVIIFIGATVMNLGSSTKVHLTAQGKVSETRIVVDHLGGSLDASRIHYRIEAHVTYTLDGQIQDRWLTASEISSSRDELAARVATPPKTCRVYWVPGHPENAKCELPKTY
jgi:hypothetical protein